MSNRRYFAVDLQGAELKFSGDGENRTWIQAMTLGTYKHPIYGQIKITSERIANFVRNFKNNVRDQELDIDYDHKAVTQKAAGWVKDVEDRGLEGLWYLVEWTAEAKRALQEKEYRYFSPEFADEWVHPKSGQKFKDVLFGGALTNRPFLKDILPINLSDFGHINIPMGDSNMNELLMKLADLLGIELSDKDSDEDNVTKLSDEIKALKERADKPASEDQDDQLKKLAETNPVIARLLAERAEDRRAIVELQARNRLSEITAMFNEAKSDKFDLPPAFVAEVKPIVVKLAESDATKLMAAIKKLTETGLVQLGEVGGTNPNNRNDGDLVKLFHEEIDKLTAGEKGLSYADAVTKICNERPELFDAYNDAQIGVR